MKPYELPVAEFEAFKASDIISESSILATLTDLLDKNDPDALDAVDNDKWKY